MILESKEHSIKSLGTIGAIGFQISQNDIAHIMQLLRNGVYSDGQSAIIRELWCNAFDSVKEAGGNPSKDVVIQLPNSMNPEIVFMDRGVGLSHEDVVKIYRNYGDSTKRNSNDQIGCLGIGSKSPFAYTDSFTVIAVKDGMKNAYIASVARESVDPVAGVGGLHQFVKNQETDESNGVTIKIPIKNSDITSFVTKMKYFFRFVLPEDRPKFIPEIEIEELPLCETFCGDNWALKGKTSIFDSYIVMGNVPYIIDSRNFPIYLPNKYSQDIGGKKVLQTVEELDAQNIITFTQEEFALLKFGFVARVPMGSVAFQVSREGLRYTPETLKTIRAVIRDILKNAKSIIQKKIEENSNSFWEAKNLYYHLFTASSPFGCKIDIQILKVLKLFENDTFKITYKDEVITNPMVNLGPNVKSLTAYKFNDENKLSLLSADNYGGSSIRAKEPEKPVLVFNDVSNYSKFQRIRYFLKNKPQNDTKKYFFVDFLTFDFEGNSKPIYEIDNKAGFEIKKLSEIPRLIIKSPSKKDVFEVNLSNVSNYKKEFLDKVDDSFDIKVGGIYINFYKNRLRLNNGKVLDDQIVARLFQSLHNNNIEIKKLYAVKGKAFKIVKNSKNWFSLEEFVSIKNRISKETIQNSVDYDYLFQKLNSNDFGKNQQVLESLRVFINKFDKNTLIYNQLRYIQSQHVVLEKLKESHQELIQHATLVSLFSLGSSAYEIKEKLKKNFKPSINFEIKLDFKNNYPLLQFLDLKLVDDKTFDYVNEYIKTCDSKLLK